MYNIFLNQEAIVKEKSLLEDNSFYNLDRELSDFFHNCSGISVDRGMYRTHTFQSSLHWSIIASNYFANFNNKLVPFGYDWMGRQFAMLNGRKDYILMLDPSTGEYFELQQSLIEFHDKELVSEKEDTLSADTFKHVLKLLKLNKLEYAKCIGYRISLFLNGVDDVSNYDVVDMEVYWEFQRQICAQVKSLPPGTKIDRINFLKP